MAGCCVHLGQMTESFELEEPGTEHEWNDLITLNNWCYYYYYSNRGFIKLLGFLTIPNAQYSKWFSWMNELVFLKNTADNVTNETRF